MELVKDKSGRYSFREKFDFDPTSARPGSREKIKILADRASQGKPLFHPRDKKVIPKNNWFAEVMDEVA